MPVFHVIRTFHICYNALYSDSLGEKSAHQPENIIIGSTGTNFPYLFTV